MATDVIQAEYETLTSIAQRFERQVDETNQLNQRVRNSFDALQGGGWIGRGAEAFFKEMEGDIFPALGRLALAMEDGRDATRQIVEVLRTAEENAAGGFVVGEVNSFVSSSNRADFPGGGVTIVDGYIPIAPIRGEGKRDGDFWDVSGTLYEYHRSWGSTNKEELPTPLGPIYYDKWGWEGEAGANVGIGDDGPQITTYGRLEGYIIQAEYNREWAGFDIAAEAQIGAEVGGNIEAEIDFSDGEVEVEGELGGFAGVSTEGSVSREIGSLDVAVTGRYGYGIGAGANFDLELKPNKIKWDYGAYFFLGPGGGARGSVELDIPQAANELMNVGKKGVDVMYNFL